MICRSPSCEVIWHDYNRYIIARWVKSKRVCLLFIRTTFELSLGSFETVFWSVKRGALVWLSVFVRDNTESYKKGIKLLVGPVWVEKETQTKNLSVHALIESERKWDEAMSEFWVWLFDWATFCFEFRVWVSMMAPAVERDCVRMSLNWLIELNEDLIDC